MSCFPEDPFAHSEDEPARFMFVASLEDVQHAMRPLLGTNTRNVDRLVDPLTVHIDQARAVTEELLADDYGDISEAVINNALAELTNIGLKLFTVFADRTPVSNVIFGFVEPVPEPGTENEPTLDKEEAVDFIVERYGEITARNIRNFLEASLTNPL